MECELHWRLKLSAYSFKDAHKIAAALVGKREKKRSDRDWSIVVNYDTNVIRLVYPESESELIDDALQEFEFDILGEYMQNIIEPELVNMD